MKLADAIDWIQHSESRALLESRSINSTFVTVYREEDNPFQSSLLLPILVRCSEIQNALSNPMWNGLYRSRHKPKLLCLKKREFLCKAFTRDFPGIKRAGGTYEDGDGTVVARWTVGGGDLQEIQISSKYIYEFARVRNWAVLLAINSTRFSEREPKELGLRLGSSDSRGDTYVYRLSVYKPTGQPDGRFSTGTNLDGMRVLVP